MRSYNYHPLTKEFVSDPSVSSHDFVNDIPKSYRHNFHDQIEALPLQPGSKSSTNFWAPAKGIYDEIMSLLRKYNFQASDQGNKESIYSILDTVLKAWKDEEIKSCNLQLDLSWA